MADLTALVEPSRAIRPRLSGVKVDEATWRSLLQCRECGCFWIQAYPWGAMQGGGPTVLLPVSSSDAVAYFRSTADLVPKITREYEEVRRKHDEKVFWEMLGADVGPKACNEPGCGRLRVKHSVFCPLHHFKMIKGHPPPAD